MATNLLLVYLLLLKLLIFTDAGSLGVCSGRYGDNLPYAQDVVNLYRRNGITKMRIYGPNQATLQALGGTNIELILDVPNDSLQSLTDPNSATSWVRNNILNYPKVRFRYIAVGNQVDPNNGKTSRFAKFVLPAMRNVQSAIRDAGLADQIKVSTATYTGLPSASSPPSAGEFHSNVQWFIRPIIRFLIQNNSPMLANIYPYFAYVYTPSIDLSYALFTAPGTVVDDAHYAAQSRLGGANLEIVVSETGWPSEGNKGATVDYARTYYKNVMRHEGRLRGLE